MENSKRRNIPRAKRLASVSDEKTAAWIDISVPIYSGMVHWPDDPGVSIERVQDLSRGDAANVSKLELGAHTGTHMDAPRHFLADGAGLDELPLDAAIGPARVIRIEHPRAILPAELEAHRLRAGERVLFLTRNSERCWNRQPVCRRFCLYQCGGRAIPRSAKGANGRNRLPLGRWVCARWRRDPSDPSRRGDLAHRRAQPVRGETRRVRAGLSAAADCRSGWRTRAGHSAAARSSGKEVRQGSREEQRKRLRGY